jgi:hypothetical protein
MLLADVTTVTPVFEELHLQAIRGQERSGVVGGVKADTPAATRLIRTMLVAGTVGIAMPARASAAIAVPRLACGGIRAIRA